jgi:hypothetical protein
MSSNTQGSRGPCGQQRARSLKISKKREVRLRSKVLRAFPL